MIIYFIIILLIIYFFLYFKENFSYFNTVNDNTPKDFSNIDNFYRIFYPSDQTTSSIYENRLNFIPITKNDISLNNDISLSVNNYDKFKSDKCCLISKRLNNNNFIYEYKKYNNSECDIDNFQLDQNNQLFFDGINNWDNNECSNDSNKLGSCQHYNFECIDFVDEKTCNDYNNKIPIDKNNRKINYTWSKKPCYNR